ncbi:MAG TPA: hypothetical protein VF699_11055 [Caulobacteraceae bacterium]|jgi:hypothetical protein
MKRAIIALGALGAAAVAGEASGLSCVHPDDQVRMADLVVIGQVASVRHVSTEKVGVWPWHDQKNVTVRNSRAEIRTVRVLKGTGAPKTFRYTFRDRLLDCDGRAPVKRGQRLVFALRRDAKTGEWTAVGRPLSAWNPDAPRVL